MNKEFEATYYPINREAITSALEVSGATCTRKKYTQIRTAWDLPTGIAVGVLIDKVEVRGDGQVLFAEYELDVSDTKALREIFEVIQDYKEKENRGWLRIRDERGIKLLLPTNELMAMQ